MEIIIHRQDGYVLEEVSKVDIDSLMQGLPKGVYRLTVKQGRRNDYYFGEVSQLVTWDGGK